MTSVDSIRARMADLVAPVSADAPCGCDPRDDASPASPWLAAKEARMRARNRERTAAFDDGVVPADDWRDVLENGIRVLADVGKDLEVAAWVIEAGLRLEGPAALVSALQLNAALIDAYWDDIFPHPFEDGVCRRLTALAALVGAGREGILAPALRNIAITDGAPPATYWNYLQARQLARCPEDRREERVAAGAMTPEAFARSVHETPPGFFQALRRQLTEAASALEALGALIQERADGGFPTPADLVELLQDILAAVNDIADEPPDDGGLAEAADEACVAETPQDAAARGSGGGSGLPASREDACRRLSDVARWFRMHEPHSPISYTLEEAVRRCRLTLPELLAELIPDEENRRFFLVAAGVRPGE